MQRISASLQASQAASQTVTTGVQFHLGRPAGSHFFTMPDISDESHHAITKAKATDAFMAFWRCLDRQRVAGKTKAAKEAAGFGRLTCGIRGLCRASGLTRKAMRRQVNALVRLRLISVIRDNPDAPGRRKAAIIIWIGTDADMRPRTKEASSKKRMGAKRTHQKPPYRVHSEPTSQEIQIEEGESLSKTLTGPLTGSLTAASAGSLPAAVQEEKACQEASQSVGSVITTDGQSNQAGAGGSHATPSIETSLSAHTVSTSRHEPRKERGGPPADPELEMLLAAMEAARERERQHYASEQAGRREAGRSRADALRERWRHDQMRGGEP